MHGRRAEIDALIEAEVEALTDADIEALIDATLMHSLKPMWMR